MKFLDDMRTTLVVQALEQSDPGEVVLLDEDKREVGVTAGAPLAKNLSTREENNFLAERAELLGLRASTRHPEETRWFRRDPNHHRFNWLAIGLCVIAVVIGFLTNELGPQKRINILSFPLLGLIAWSLIVYVRELVLFFQNRDRLFRDGWLQGLIRFVQPEVKKPEPKNNSEAAGILRVASQLFADRWREIMTPVTGTRVKSLLHLVVFLLSASAIAGMYVKGLANEYRAIWESTFFTDSSSLRPFLEMVLGPAARLTGENIPSVAELNAMHWMSGKTENVTGENAARWIHWYAITVGIFVLIPRLVLSFLWRWRGSRLLRTLPFREVSPGYFENILSISSGAALEIRVAPYSIDLDDNTRRAVRSCLETQYERPVEITWAPGIPFGKEDEIEVAEDEISIIPLFHFASTPEKETHLALLQNLLGVGSNPVDENGNRVHMRVEFLLLDTTAFNRKADSFADADKRRGDREKAWEQLLEGSGIEPLFFSQDQPYRKPKPNDS